MKLSLPIAKNKPGSFHFVRPELVEGFSTDAQSWLNLQLSYDLKIAEAELKDRIEREVEEMAA